MRGSFVDKAGSVCKRRVNEYLWYVHTELTKVQDLMNEGSALYSQGNYAQAQELFEKASMEDPMHEDAYIFTAQACIMQDKFDEAKESLKKALLINKKNGNTYFHLGNVEMLLGNSSVGLILFLIAIALINAGKRLK